MKTAVHINQDGTLVVLPAYLQRRFGTWKTPNVDGACLLMQVGSMYNRQLGVASTVIQKALLNFAARRQHIASEGLPLDQTLEAFEHLSPWRMTGCIPRSTGEAARTLCQGMPLMLVVDSAMIDASRTYTPVMRMNRYFRDVSVGDDYTHCLLVIGYDREAKQLIVRESRSKYTKFNGLTKINVSELHDWKEGWRMFEPVFERC
jgi:hypothetical protein